MEIWNPIHNIALKKFWIENIGIKCLKTSVVLEQLLDHVSSNDSSEEVRSQLDVIMSTDAKIQIMIALDIDGMGMLTAIKVDRATRSIPTTCTLVETLFILSRQRGKVVLPPIYSKTMEETLIYSARQTMETILSAKDATGRESIQFSPFQYHDLTGNDPQDTKVLATFAKPGWHLIGGVAAVGKTVRVLSALKAHLFAISKREVTKLVSVTDVVTTSHKMLDPFAGAGYQVRTQNISTCVID